MYAKQHPALMKIFNGNKAFPFFGSNTTILIVLHFHLRNAFKNGLLTFINESQSNLIMHTAYH